MSKNFNQSRIDRQTIHHYLVSVEEDLTHNGYTVLKGEKLKQFKQMFGNIIYADLDFDESQSDIGVTLSEKIDHKQNLNRLKNECYEILS